ncbi:MAG: phage tail tube protein [Alphaproteobacteria bacterium]
MPLYWRNKVLLAKLEATYGTDPVPTGAANAILAVDMRLTPMDGQDVSRELELPWMGSQPTVAAELHARLSFRVELAPSGDPGVAPAWAPLLRACAMSMDAVADTSVTFAPVSTGHASVAIEFWIENTRHRIAGARGNCTVRLAANAVPYLEFEFTGLFVQPAEGMRPTPDVAAFATPEIAVSAHTQMTIGAWTPVVRSAALNFGNQVENRFLIGAEAVLVTDKAGTLEATVEAVPLTTWNPYQLAYAQTQVPVTVVHGTAAGRMATIALPAAQVQRPQGLENAQGVTEWPLRFVPLPVAGNDQFTLTLT